MVSKKSNSVADEVKKIAYVYYQPIPKVVRSGKKEYAFVVKWGISLAFIDETDVSGLSAFKAGCCGHHNGPAFKPATPGQIQVWNTGHYG